MELLRSGSRGEGVRELQQKLSDAGFDPGPIDGVFGSKTDAAVRKFQESKGITVDGIVGPMTWSKLDSKYIPDQKEEGSDSAVLTPLPKSGTGYYLYPPGSENVRHYGRQSTINKLEKLGRQWDRAHGSNPGIGIGDISIKGGGLYVIDGVQRHDGHQKGLEVDIRPMRKDTNRTGVKWNDKDYSRELTRALVNKIISIGDVYKIYFNDEVLLKEITQLHYLKDHDDHLHVRYNE
jgi:Putative peptidoglycan binding domain/Penicillin-insensitive murein endopeptidase